MHFKLGCNITLIKVRIVFDVSFPIMIIFCKAGNTESGGVFVLFFKLGLTYLQQGCM